MRIRVVWWIWVLESRPAKGKQFESQRVQIYLQPIKNPNFWFDFAKAIYLTWRSRTIRISLLWMYDCWRAFLSCRPLYNFVQEKINWWISLFFIIVHYIIETGWWKFVYRVSQKIGITFSYFLRYTYLQMRYTRIPQVSFFFSLKVLVKYIILYY